METDYSKYVDYNKKKLAVFIRDYSINKLSETIFKKNTNGRFTTDELSKKLQENINVVFNDIENNYPNCVVSICESHIYVHRLRPETDVEYKERINAEEKTVERELKELIRLENKYRT